MEEFRKNFSVYSAMLCFTALWPYDESLLGTIQRVTLSVLYLSLLVIQISTLKWVEKSTYNVLIMLSFTTALILYFLRYVGFSLNRPLMRAVFDSFSKDYSVTKDPVELDIFARQIKKAKRVILAFLGLTIVLLAYMCVVILLPTILRSDKQIQYLRIFGFFYPEMSQQSDWVSIFFVLVNAMGLLSIASTESAIAVSAAYLCGLLEIASYRIQVAIDNVVHSNTSELIHVEPVVDLHKRAAALVSSFRYSNYITVYSIVSCNTTFVSFPSGNCRSSTLITETNEMIVSYLISIATAIISFALNLYRLLLAVHNPQDFASLFFTVNDVLLHGVFMYLTNLSGQRVINTSACIFNEICSSAWYCIPLPSQKILLFMLLRSVKEIRCNVGGFYDLGFDGLTMLVSTSFSYFTVMSSMQ